MDAQLYQEFGQNEDTHWWFTARRAIVKRFLQANLPSSHGLKVIDVGCGTGGMLPLLAEFGHDVTGLDTSDDALKFAQTRAPSARLLKGQLPDGLPAGEQFDLITAFDVIEHIPDAVSALKVLRGALTPNGRLVVTVPAFQFLWSDHDVLNHHQRRYNDALLREHLSGAGFTPEHSSYFNTWLFPGIAAVRLIQKLSPKTGGASDFSIPSPLMNKALELLFGSERFLVARNRLPVGVSLIGIARP